MYPWYGVCPLEGQHRRLFAVTKQTQLAVIKKIQHGENGVERWLRRRIFDDRCINNLDGGLRARHFLVWRRREKSARHENSRDFTLANLAKEVD